MRTSVSYIVLALAARSAAYPVAAGLHIRDDPTKPTVPIVNVDGPDGDSDTPQTVTVTRHSVPTTVTHRVTDTVVYTTHKPTTIISIVPVDGKPDQNNEHEDVSKAPQPTAVTITIWESSAAAPSLPGTPSSTITSVLTTATPTTRPAVVDPEPEPTTDVVTPPSPTSQAVGENSSTSSIAVESELPSSSPSLPPAPTTSIAGDAVESSTATPQSSAPAEPIVPQPSASTTELESFTELPVSTSASVPAASSSTPAAWDEVAPSSASAQASSTPSVVVSPPDVITLWPPAPESSIASTPSLSTPPVPSTFVWVSSITSAPSPEATSVHTNDDGYWYSSKYPSWNSTAPYAP
ncbi:hypothetical protein F5X68DRAFT_213595 [Plectosphaerella plurivora]|uniref:Uncharacterized protein n=1 Tax=Plectosphaerella plurivora TaxID=936078 RepID=A0A9P8V5F5_9PEZI|nr:hypothetical protein F5X68DRAFT_213595 [Plectosphaerella plurivora]